MQVRYELRIFSSLTFSSSFPLCHWEKVSIPLNVRVVLEGDGIPLCCEGVFWL